MLVSKRQKTIGLFFTAESRRIDNRIDKLIIIISFLPTLPIVTIQDEMEVYRPIYGRVSPQ